MISKRSFLIGLIAAPVVIKSGILMPIKVIKPIKTFNLADYEFLMNKMIENWQRHIANQIIYGSDFNYGGLKFFVKDDKIESERISIHRIFK